MTLISIELVEQLAYRDIFALYNLDKGVLQEQHSAGNTMFLVVAARHSNQVIQVTFPESVRGLADIDDLPDRIHRYGHLIPCKK